MEKGLIPAVAFVLALMAASLAFAVGWETAANQLATLAWVFLALSLAYFLLFGNQKPANERRPASGRFRRP